MDVETAFHDYGKKGGGAILHRPMPDQSVQPKIYFEKKNVK
jgi:hypothetical protein